jgi:hypothetical protein
MRMVDEKRAHERRSVRYAVRIRLSDGRRIDGCVENLGPLGAFVSTSDLEAHLEIGDHVALEIDLGGDREPAEAHGEVLRLEQEFSAGDIRRSFAVRFNESFASF